MGDHFTGSARGGFDRDKIFEAVKSWNGHCICHWGRRDPSSALKLHGWRRNERSLFHSLALKTIDNDIDIIDRSFGFETAIEEARNAINCAKTEAECAPNGVGIVKLMGRHAGFIAVHATLASGDVDLVLIPELPVNVTQEALAMPDHVKSVILKKGHAVVVVAEGAGEDLLLREVTGPPAMRDPPQWGLRSIKQMPKVSNQSCLNRCMDKETS